MSLKNKEKRIFNINKRLILVLMLLLVVVSGTFAWFTYKSRESALVLAIGDINDSKVIIKPYEIRETMTPVNTYTSGVYSQVQVINNNSNEMNLKLFYRINNLDEILINNGLRYTIASSTTLDGEYTKVETGDFTLIENNQITIFNQKIDGKSILYYRVYLWLDSSVGSQETIQDSILDVELNGIVNLAENTPVLGEGMIPVIISNDGTVTTISSIDDNWYDYDNQKWANIVLVNEDSRSNYLNTTGVNVDTSDILAYYVWIPRYKYQIWTTSISSKGNEQEIDIKFESGDEKYSVATAVGEYQTHPAFWWDDDNNGIVSSDELISGIWVGKFEATGSADSPTILPNVTSLRGQNVSTQFQTSLKFSGGTLSNGTVTFAGSDTYGLSSSTNSHMAKNSEWGAIAYLSHSKYGINQEIRINNNSNYTTGCGASTANGGKSTLCQIAYGGATDYPQSTTGNITGIYDMSGGTFEYVMGNYGNTAGSSGFSTLPESKYYDLYTITSNSSCTLATCGGHALYETANWYGDYTAFVASGNPWFMRGGRYLDGADAGAFHSHSYTGTGVAYYTWRSVLIPKETYNVIYDSNGGSFNNKIELVKYTSSGEYTYTVPATGTYQLEVWGAQGGYGQSTTYRGGYGGYSKGNIYLDSGTNLYVNVGGQGGNGTSKVSTLNAGGYNGGGDTYGTTSKYVGSGGGATHIATESGILSSLSDYAGNNNSPILIVAGGGGGGAYESSSYTSIGGDGGGYVGASGQTTSTSYAAGTGGTQTAGGSGLSSGSFGQGGNATSDSIGGGGGYYGGGVGKYSSGSGGGSGYIGNVNLTNKYMYCYNCTTSDEESTKTYTTTNVSSTPISNYAKSGNGAAKITTSSFDIEKIKYNSKYDTMPTPKRAGYIFLGWNTKKDGSGEYITEKSTYLETSDQILYAMWEEVITMSYDANGGEFDSVIYTSSGEHTYTASSTGTYQLEVWGAQGGDTDKMLGGYGGYSTGSIFLDIGNKLYVNVGGQGNSNCSNITCDGGYNGGGKSGIDSASYVSSGGGATHIATISGQLSTLENYKGALYEDGITYNSSTILIVAGGGGGSANYPTTGTSEYGNGGSGGGIIGGNGTFVASTTSSYAYGIGGTQFESINKNISGSFGAGGSNTNGASCNSGSVGGGGGFYGGTTGYCISGGGGGSGYIGSSLLSNKYMYCYDCTTSNEESTKTYTTTNVSSTPTTSYAKKGDGAAKIVFTSTDKIIKSGYTYELPENPTRFGYTFLGWNTKQDGSGENITGESIFSGNSDQTLYAQWKIDTYTISYDANGGSGVPTSQIKTYGEDIILSDLVPTKDEYRFKGWSESPTATKATYPAGGTFTSNKSTVLYAVWGISTIPEFEYTGDYEIVDDDDNAIEDLDNWTDDWKIRFLTSGELTFSVLNDAASGIDVFLVGGGGAGGMGHNTSTQGGAGGGGGGGYTNTKLNLAISTNTPYSIVVGGSGGSTSAFEFSVSGGSDGSGGIPNFAPGGSGGSGGGDAVSSGGVDGANGGGSSGGAGQGRTTREFGESTGKLYATGGAGGTHVPGASNTGDGGGGNLHGNSNPVAPGGSGIVVIRNAREKCDFELNTIPEFTYTGEYLIVDDDDNVIGCSYDNWKIKFLSSGTLTFTNLRGASNGIDTFLVGGGGAGGMGYNTSTQGGAGGGGGGGYTTTKLNLSISTNTSYNIVVGGSGGSTSAFEFSVSGGSNGGRAANLAPGGAGGSGGGDSRSSGGVDGANGGGSSGGAGQGTTTREFGESTGKIYATGGTGGNIGRIPGASNTGDGGGGNLHGYSNPVAPGGSGIVVIRNAR